MDGRARGVALGLGRNVTRQPRASLAGAMDDPLWRRRAAIRHLLPWGRARMASLWQAAPPRHLPEMVLRGRRAVQQPECRYTRIGISTYSASGFALSVTMVGAEPSAKRNSTCSTIWSVMSFR